MVIENIKKLKLDDEIMEILINSKSIIFPEKRTQFLEMALGGENNNYFEVKFKIDDQCEEIEAIVTKCNNGIVVNYPDIYMRRRDPDSMVIGDNEETDKPRFKDLYGDDFDNLRIKTFEWLKTQELIVMPFMAGGYELGYEALLIAPKNTAFFALALADIQGFIPYSELSDNFNPKAIAYVAPPFRHTFFSGKQVVIHNRKKDLHEIFSYNLYPGPSAKKGIYGVLLNIGESEKWVSVHASTVKIVTPYDNEIVIVHEGASGGGKSEMIQQMHKEKDNKVLLAQNIVTNEKFYLEIKESCDIYPVTDDIALVHPKLQNGNKKMVVKDAEQGWFVRLDNITHYGTDPQLEKICIQPPEPLVFFNVVGVPGSTCLIWEHTMDEPGKPCPNPRVILPRKFIPNIVDTPVDVDIRSFGVRTPPCTKEKPTYGIVGLMHILTPALAWLWRLVSPRGYANPSITDSEALSSEGVGSYWPFATGKKVKQANLLLEQILSFSNTRYILIPNQYIGAYKVGFMPEWIIREYLAKRGSTRFKQEQITPSKCSLLGYSLESIKFEGTYIPKQLLQVDLQPEVGEDGFNKGMEILNKFFKKELKNFITDELDPLGKKIIECCMDNGTIEDYNSLIPTKL
ncbi:DUF4914 family protein [Caldicellulosiruptoraceae bacterium PP1]